MENDDEVLLTQYDILARTTSDISNMRQTANSFYLAATTVLLGIVSYLGTTSNLTSIGLCVAGIVISLAWKESIQSYKRINSAKFKVLLELEKKLAYPIFAKEKEYLIREKHTGLANIEINIPYLFITAYLVIILIFAYSYLRLHVIE